jgi:hypothetical protein
MILPLPSHVRGSETVQFRIDELQQFAFGRLIAFSGPLQQDGDIGLVHF